MCDCWLAPCRVDLVNSTFAELKTAADEKFESVKDLNEKKILIACSGAQKKIEVSWGGDSVPSSPSSFLPPHSSPLPFSLLFPSLFRPSTSISHLLLAPSPPPSSLPPLSPPSLPFPLLPPLSHLTGRSRGRDTALCAAHEDCSSQ